MKINFILFLSCGGNSSNSSNSDGKNNNGGSDHAAASNTCSISGYTLGDSTWCIVVRSLATAPAIVSLDFKYTIASNAAQWHLNNTGQFGGTAGNDINAEGAWSQGAYGKMKHVEVSDRSVMSLSWNPQTKQRDPTPLAFSDSHGTSYAGVAAAANNNYCGQGAAPMASIAAYKLHGFEFSADVADHVHAMYYDEVSDDGRRVSVNSNSWGPGQSCYFEPTNPLIAKSIQQGADNGRNGLGVVYVWAAGNEGSYGGDANMYPYCKLAEVMCIAGSDFNGKRIFYSNTGANLFVNAPTRGQMGNNPAAALFPAIITAKMSTVGTATNCKGDFGGTSSSTPLVAGIVAQILGVRPDLTYRDVQHIIQQTADRNDPSSSTWMKNGAGIWFSHFLGFGRINAGNAVALARKWIKLGNVTGTATPVISVNQPIIDNAPSQPVISKFIFDSREPDLPDTLEHVMVYLTMDHKRPNDLRILLTSPYGTIAVLALPQQTREAVIFDSYPFAARCFWGESPVGIWIIRVTDEIADTTGIFNSWSMEVTGNGTSTKW